MAWRVVVMYYESEPKLMWALSPYFRHEFCSKKFCIIVPSDCRFRGTKWFSTTPYVSQNIMAITFPADLEIIAFVGEGEEGCFQTEL
jgi:hypothetical protein